MFSLIITIISIALVAALALATLYYGGDSFNKGSAEANASKVINQGQQIAGAYTLYATEQRNVASGFAALVSGNYLKSIPDTQGVAWRPLVANKDTFWLPEAVDKATCKAINAKLNNTAGIPAKPVADWARQCYGENDKFYVIWNGPAGEPIGTIVAEAVAATKDSAGTTVPAALSVGSVPTGLTGADNTWTEAPLADGSTVPPAPDNTPLFSVGFNQYTGQFDKASVSITGAKYMSLEGSALSSVSLTCNDANNPSMGWPFYNVNVAPSGNSAVIDFQSGMFNNFAYPNCQTGSQNAQITFRYENGFQETYKYTLNFAGIDAAASRPSDPLLAQVYDNIEVNVPASNSAVWNAIEQLQFSTGHYGFRILENNYASHLQMVSHSIHYYTGCAENDPIVNCQAKVFNTGYIPVRNWSSSMYTYIPFYNNEIKGLSQYFSQSVNNKAFVEILIQNTNTGQNFVVVKPFVFDTNSATPSGGWTF